MIGVDGVGIVGGHQQTAGQQHLIALPVHVQRTGDAPQHVPQQGGGGALRRGGADLLVVQQAEHRQVRAAAALQKPVQAAPHAGLIVQPGRHEQLAAAAQPRTRLAAVYQQVAAQHVLRAQPGGLRRQGQDVRRAIVSGQRQRVHVGAVLDAVVGGAVEVNGHTGDHQQVAVDVHQRLAEDAVLLGEQPPGHRQRPVEPAGHAEAAVDLRVQPQIAAVPQGGIFLQLEAGRVPVRRRQTEALRGALRHAEGDQGRAAPRHVIFPAGAQLPALSLVQRGISGRRQQLCGGGCRVVAGGAARDELRQCVDVCPFHGVPPMPGTGRYVVVCQALTPPAPAPPGSGRCR